jgi:hypothetical protein
VFRYAFVAMLILFGAVSLASWGAVRVVVNTRPNRMLLVGDEANEVEQNRARRDKVLWGIGVSLVVGIAASTVVALVMD